MQITLWVSACTGILNWGDAWISINSTIENLLECRKRLMSSLNRGKLIFGNLIAVPEFFFKSLWKMTLCPKAWRSFHSIAWTCKFQISWRCRNRIYSRLTHRIPRISIARKLHVVSLLVVLFYPNIRLNVYHTQKIRPFLYQYQQDQDSSDLNL